MSVTLRDCCERDTKELFKPKEMVVAAIKVGIDNFVGGSLRVTDVPT